MTGQPFDPSIELIESDLRLILDLFELLPKVAAFNQAHAVTIVFTTEAGDTFYIGYGENAEPALLRHDPPSGQGGRVMGSGGRATLPEWPEKDRLCVKCLRPMATDADDQRHVQQYGSDDLCDDQTCWCRDLCWEANFSGWCPGPDDLGVDADNELGLLLIIRGLQEAVRGRPPPEGPVAGHLRVEP